MNSDILKTLLGRGWKASELRLKSWDDLQKLWYVLLKEKNMLMTQRQMLNAQNLRFPNPERISKVKLVSFEAPNQAISYLYFDMFQLDSPPGSEVELQTNLKILVSS